MKKWIYALLALLMLLSCAALAEDATLEATPDAAVEASASVAEAADSTVTAENSPEPAPVGSITVGFEDGFALELPADWLHYELTDAMAEKGVLYCLSDSSSSHWLYIQRWTTDCADIDALSDLINEISQPQTSGVYNFNGTDFIVYDLTEGDVSCCAALLDGNVLNFVFTPQSDADFMVTAAQIIGTFAVL